MRSCNQCEKKGEMGAMLNERNLDDLVLCEIKLKGKGQNGLEMFKMESSG